MKLTILLATVLALVAASTSQAGRTGTSFAQLKAIVASGGYLTLQTGSACQLPSAVRGSKIVTLPGVGFCSVATRLRRAPVFGREDEALKPTYPIFKKLFLSATDPRGRPVASVFISVQGPITTVGGKTKWDVVLNANCTRAAARQISWENIDTAGFEQLCVVHKFVKFS